MTSCGRMILSQLSKRSSSPLPYGFVIAQATEAANSSSVMALMAPLL